MSAVLGFPEENYRAMREDDLTDVISIENFAYEFPWSETIFADCIRSGYECWVIESDDKTIGYMIFMLVADECHLLNLCVNPKVQSRGYGRRALTKMFDFLIEKKISLIFLEVRPSNHAAIGLYESEGFNQMGLRKNYYPAAKGREDALLFAKQL